MSRRARASVAVLCALLAIAPTSGGAAGSGAAIAGERAGRVSCPASTTWPPPAPDEPGALRTFSDDEFQRLVDLTGPTRVLRGDSPAILGDAVADDRIRAIAERRGYRPRADVGVAGLALASGRLLDRSTAAAWRAMQSAAGDAGITLTLWSGYRSVERQRQIFRNKLSGRGIGAGAVRAGLADAAIDDILRFSSIPGYSRHHSGRTIDVLTPGFGSGAFSRSAAYRWLSRDNYANAKAHGFVPSYPPAAGAQGPDPESWELVHVSRSAVTESPRLATLQGFESAGDVAGAPATVVEGTPGAPDDEYVLYADDSPLVAVTGRCSPGAVPGVLRLSSPAPPEADLCVVQRWADSERLLACAS